MTQNQQNALTDPNFWDNYWANTKVPQVATEKSQWQLALMKKFKYFLPNRGNIKLFEVGGAPGRWLVWFAQEMEYDIATCDTSVHGLNLTRQNFELNNVNGEIYAEDFLTGALPVNIYDVVLSIGFIEHFDDPMPIIQRHLDLLKPGGTLVLEVPNFAGRVNHWMLQQAGMQNLLTFHNLSIMNKSYFNEIAERFDLQIDFLDYIGGYDPMVVTGSYPYRVRHVFQTGHYIVPVLTILEKFLFRLAPQFFIRFNSSAYSSILLGIFRKKE